MENSDLLPATTKTRLQPWNVDLPPHDPEGERAILGCILLDPLRALGECIETLHGGEESFYDHRNRAIYRTFLEMYEVGEGIDVITLRRRLTDSGLLEQVGGIQVVSSLPDLVPSSHNLPAYVESVNHKFMFRKILRFVAGIGEKAHKGAGSSTELIEELERCALQIRPNRRSKTLCINDLITSVTAKIEDVWQKRKAGEPFYDGILTGFIDLDRLCGGLRDGEVTILAGYPGSGKTALALNIAQNAMTDGKRRVAVFSLEMPAEALVTRFLCSHGRLNLRGAMHGEIRELDIIRLSKSALALSGSAVYFEDQSDLSVYELQAAARRMKQEYKIDLFIIDYLQLLTATGGSRKFESRQQEVSDISRVVKSIARELRVPVIAASQLNDDGKLRESRAIGQDADNVWVLRVDEKNDHPLCAEVSLNITKARNGPRGTVNLIFQKEFTRFENRSRVEEEPGTTTLPYADR